MLTTQQTAKRLGVSPRRVLALIKSGKLPAMRFGKAWAVDEDALRQFIATWDRKPGYPAGRPRK